MCKGGCSGSNYRPQPAGGSGFTNTSRGRPRSRGITPSSSSSDNAKDQIVVQKPSVPRRKGGYRPPRNTV